MATIQANVDFGGPARAGQSVDVYNHGTTTHAAIFRSDGVTALPNPTTVSGNGHVVFQAAAGTYDVVGTDLTRTVVLAVPAAPPSASALGVATTLGNVSGTVTLDASLATAWTATLTGDVTFDFVNVPAGKVFEPQVVATQDGTGSHTVSFSENGSLISPQWDTGTAMTAAPSAGATTVFNLQTVDGGTSWFGLGKAASASVTNTLAPADVGLVAWTATPNLVATSKAPTAGQLWCTKVKAPPGAVCTKLWYYLSTIAAGAANSYLGVYDQAGNRLSVSANLSNTDFIGANSFYRSTLMPAFTVPTDGILIIAILVGSATTVPVFAGVQNSAAAGNAIAQDGSKGYLVFTYGTGLTVMPAAIALSAANCTMAAQAIQFGVGA